MKKNTTVVAIMPRLVVAVFMIFICFWLALGSTGNHVLAAPLPPPVPLPASEQQALNEWTNWVAANCGSGSSGPVGSITSLTGSDHEHEAYNFLIGEGLTQAQSVGILANLINESGVDPTSGAPPTNGVGFGIVQWTFTARQASLKTFAASQNPPNPVT